MAHIFEVTASAENTAQLDASGMGQVAFTVTNITAAPVKGRAVLGAENSPVLPWLTLDGEKERLIHPKQSDTFVVRLAVPAEAKPGNERSVQGARRHTY